MHPVMLLQHLAIRQNNTYLNSCCATIPMNRSIRFGENLTTEEVSGIVTQRSFLANSRLTEPLTSSSDDPSKWWYHYFRPQKQPHLISEELGLLFTLGKCVK